MLTVPAPAKLNLTLEVLGKRPDGFHEIRSVIQAINLCDSLRFQLSQEVTVKSDMPDWSAEESLVSKAASLLQRTTGCSKGASIEVEKLIPLISGLGGDSSDAAAALRGLNQLWKLGLTQEKLVGLAAQLGSDVAFFLYGGTALAEGRGELVTPLPPPPQNVGGTGGAGCVRAAGQDQTTLCQP
ncbi:4-(cytidine 5'-diphospho)-2-C-methyl-D-erythritol kinase [Chloroflexota bacterium]